MASWRTTGRELLAATGAEMRSTRRLARTWLFTLLSIGIGLVIFVALSILQMLASSQSPSLGFLNPRFLVSSSSGVVVLWVFMVAVVFLAFDVRARDERDRMAQVLDARPIGNLTLLLGRLAGLVLTVWLPMLVLVGLIQTLGFTAQAIGAPFAEPVEPYSALAFLTIDALPMLAFWCALVMLLAVVLRNRLFVALVALVLLGGYWWATVSLPIYLLGPFAGLTGYTGTPSDVVPHFATSSDIAQRAAELLLAGGLLALAAALHPRPDRAAPDARWALGAALVLAGAAVIGALAWRAQDGLALRAQWLAAHQARQDQPRADLERIRGRVAIDPGEGLQLDVELRLTTPPDALGELVFSFNPGMAVAELALDGEAAAFSHDAGVLVVELPATFAGGRLATLALSASGVPDTTFGYLDSALDLPRLTSEAGNLLLLGGDVGVFENAYVALMPGMYWLPVPGAAVGREDPARYGKDFYTVDLAVHAPQQWLVAGPGRREALHDGGFRFRPGAPLPEVALLAAPFERYALEAAGVELELLVSAKHRRNVRFFAEAAEEIQQRLAEMLGGAENLGLGYPYGALSLVETPAGLRTFGGGWRMASVQALPGVLLLPEYGFPSSRFEFRFLNNEQLASREGGLAAAQADILQRYFDNDISGGNPFQGAARNLLAFQTGAVGEGALALDFVVHDLARRLLTPSDNGYFSPYTFAAGADMGAMMQQAMLDLGTGQGASIASNVHSAATNRAGVWDRALGVSLAALDPADEPKRALDVLWLKGPAIARSVLDGLGREAAAGLLADLRQRYQGRNFTAADFAALTRERGVDLAPIVGDWLHDASLPGFLVSPATVVRLADDDQGVPRYQAKVHVFNDEATPGVVRLGYVVANEGGGTRAIASAPVRVAGGEARELGLLSRAPPRELWLHPVLSLNRHDLRLPVPEVDESGIVEDAAFTGSRPSEWRPKTDAGIVVDDLDPGFSVRYDDAEDFRLSGGVSDLFTPEMEIDQGLPTFTTFTTSLPGWTRQELSDGWGKYRRTTARVRAGDGRAKAVFTTDLPQPGRWRVDYHLPDPRGATLFGGGGTGQGGYALHLVARGVDVAVEFDAAAAATGWNDLGAFNLPGGPVSLVVSNETSGRVVFADAARWRPEPSAAD